MHSLKKRFDLSAFLGDTLLPALLILTLIPSMMLNALHLRREYSNPNYVEVDRNFDDNAFKQEKPAAPEVSKVIVTGPREGRVGQLIEVSATPSTGATFKWVVRGVDPANVRVLSNSVVFSSPDAADVDVFVAVALGDKLVVEHVNVVIVKIDDGKVVTPDKRPVVKTLAVELYPLITEVETDEKLKEQREIAGAFKQVATLIKEGAVTTIEEAVSVTKVLVKKATSTAGEAWKKVISRIEQETESAADAGKLKTLEDHAKHWEMISNALDPNPSA